MNKLTPELEKKLLLIDDDYTRAYELVSYLFAGIKDKEGAPYIGHLKRVSDSLTNSDTKVAGLLHDVVEDIEEITFDTLKRLKFNDRIIEMVRIVTHDLEVESNYDYIIENIISTNNIEAIKLKFADISDNLNEKRISTLDEKMRNYLINKYQKNYEKLKQYLEERREKI